MLAQLYAEAFGRLLLYLHGLKTRAKLYAQWETYVVCIYILKHKTITDIRIFMHSYNELIPLLMLITDLCLFGSPIGVTELITRAYYKAYTDTSYLILTQNLHL